jgi:hypothetical protein
LLPRAFRRGVPSFPAAFGASIPIAIPFNNL